MADQPMAPPIRPKRKPGRPRNDEKRVLPEDLAARVAPGGIDDAVVAAMNEGLEETPPPRPDLRPNQRPEMKAESPRSEMKGDPREDSVAAAERRYQELIGHDRPDLDSTDELKTPPAPAGWTYGWKRESVLQQTDPAYSVRLQGTGWSAVPAHRHPHMMPDTGHHEAIRRGGLILMEIPSKMEALLREREMRKAVGQIRTKEQQLMSTPPGQLERVRNKSGRQYEQPEPGEIPETKYERDGV